jgi:hypothetical protein
VRDRCARCLSPSSSGALIHRCLSLCVVGVADNQRDLRAIHEVVDVLHSRQQQFEDQLAKVVDNLEDVQSLLTRMMAKQNGVCTCRCVCLFVRTCGLCVGAVCVCV